MAKGNESDLSAGRAGLESSVRFPPAPDAYLGLGYEAASRRGMALIRYAERSGSWWNLPEHLVLLRAQMRRSLAPAAFLEAQAAIIQRGAEREAEAAGVASLKPAEAVSPDGVAEPGSPQTVGWRTQAARGRCQVCGRPSEVFLRCMRPDCPDGRGEISGRPVPGGYQPASGPREAPPPEPPVFPGRSVQWLARGAGFLVGLAVGLAVLAAVCGR